MSSETLFLQAVTAYRIWLDCGKDFLDHADLFEIWDDAVTAYAMSINSKRSQAVTNVVMAMNLFQPDFRRLMPILLSPVVFTVNDADVANNHLQANS